jgi:hypothetical protein
MADFNFKLAQQYELESSKQWMDESFIIFMKSIQKNRDNNIVNPHYMDLYFQNDEKVWNDFYLNNIKDKKCLECSSGPCGIMPLWGHLITDKFIIDPLILEYNKYLIETYHDTWFLPNTIMYDKCVEELIPELVNAIDGFIMFRNGIDHLENPIKAMENLAKYAKSGCKLLFWGDLKHIETPDEGHCEIVVNTIEEFEEIVNRIGFKILYTTPNIRDPKKVLDYGCVAIKI